MRIPGPKWGAGRPPLETPKSRCAIRIGRTPRRFAAGASVPLGKAASACALATTAAPPPLRGGGCAPLPPMFPIGKRLPITRACWGLRPPCPLCSPKGKVCLSCAPVGGFAPLPPRSPLGNVCRSCAHAHGTASETALRATPSQISRKLLPRKRLGVPSNPDFIASFGARIAAEGRASATAGGIPKGAQPSLASLCLLSAGQKVGAPARPERVEGESENFQKA